MTVLKDNATRPRFIALEKAANGISALRLLADYSPKRPEFAMREGNTLTAVLASKREAERQAAINLATARDETIATEWALVNFMHGAAEQVIRQYGPDSDELQSIGYKKKSDYKRMAKQVMSDNL